MTVVHRKAILDLHFVSPRDILRQFLGAPGCKRTRRPALEAGQSNELREDLQLPVKVFFDRLPVALAWAKERSVL